MQSRKKPIFYWITSVACEACPRDDDRAEQLPYVFNHIRDENNILILKGAAKKINRLIGLYKSLAQKKGCYFLDVSKKVLPSEIDGMHLDEKGHQKMAKLLHDKIGSVDF